MDELNNLTVEFFDNKDSAEQAFQEAIRLGYKPNEINVLMSENSRQKYYHSDSNTELGESTKGLASGGAIGAAVGGSIGALIALGTNFALPGLGLIIAGPLAAAGGISGALLGSLFGWSTQEALPEPYETIMENGVIILAVKESPEKPSLKNAWMPYKSKTNYSK